MEYHQVHNPGGNQDVSASPSPIYSASRKRIHWRAPAIMVSSLLVGFALVLGHHFFYQSLHLLPTREARFEQQLNTNIGTAFAFVVRMFFVISVATAYWQLFWHQVKARPTPVSTLDTLSSLIENALEFFSVRTLIHFPILAFMAVIIWYGCVDITWMSHS